MSDAPFEEIVAVLSGAPMCFLGTEDEGKPHVWPFQFQFADDRKLWFCTSKEKEIYQQMAKNPWIEFCAVMPDTRSVRIWGRAVLEDRWEIKQKILDKEPLIKEIYPTPDSSGFTSFYLAHGFYSFFDLLGNAPREGNF